MGLSAQRPPSAHIAIVQKTQIPDSTWMTKSPPWLSTTAPACARLVLLEMTLPELSSLPLWADPGPGSAHNGREDSSGSVISSKTSLAHAGAVVDNQGGDFVI